MASEDDDMKPVSDDGGFSFNSHSSEGEFDLGKLLLGDAYEAI